MGVDPTTGQIRDVVTGLTAPTDLEVSPDGHTLWVLELCDRFVEPVTNRQEMLDQKTHGGFRRFSGRLLEIDRSSGSVVTIARELDTPTNLSTGEALLFVSTGMGTSGRNIPTPGGDAQPLEGRIVGIYRETSPASSRPQCRSTEILRRRFQHRSLMGR